MAMPKPVDAVALSGLRSSALTDDVSFLLARANAIALAAGNAALAEHGLKARSYSVLVLASGDARPSQRELAEFLMLDPSQIVALVDELEDRRLVSRETNPRDRRSKGICATVAGKRLYGEARAIVRAAESESLAPLDDDERQQLRSLLRRIAFAD